MADKKINTIVVTGRGGSGKSTFSALSNRILMELGWKPTLVVDSDPDESLSSMLGIDIRKHGKKTISEIFYEIVKEKRMLQREEPGLSNTVEDILLNEALYKSSEGFDFLVLGTKWFEGCYCAPDLVLGEIMVKWSQDYEYIIVDSPAGIEHINRRINKEVKDFFNILDPSKKSFENAKISHRLIRELSIEYENYYTIGGYLFPDKLEKLAKEQQLRYLGKISYDEKVMDYNYEGKSLLNLPDDSPAYKSVKKIIFRAGYSKKPLSMTDLLELNESH